MVFMAAVSELGRSTSIHSCTPKVRHEELVRTQFEERRFESPLVLWRGLHRVEFDENGLLSEALRFGVSLGRFCCR